MHEMQRNAILADVCLDDEMGRVKWPRSGGCDSKGMREYDTIHIALGGIVHYS